MKRFFSLTWFLVALALGGGAHAQGELANNVILVTIDGLRWQEVFRGMDVTLAEKPEFTGRKDTLETLFGAGTPGESARKLMPFVHETMLGGGSVIGNRDAGSCARVTNPWFFSYPGYNEILTGVADPGIDSNSPVPNPNVSFMEWLQDNVAGFNGNVAAFASWDVFPFILNSERSRIPVNVGPLSRPQNAFEETLNLLHDDIPSSWETVRLDAFTHHFALSAMRHNRPRVLYIAYGETDDFAHDGQYDQYLMAANRTDRHLRELWTQVQADPFYRDRTVLLVTVDHGRGEFPPETWQHHASKASLSGYMESLARYEDGITGSDAVWMAAIGPGIRSAGLVQTPGWCTGSNQVAATLLHLLGIDYRDFNAKAGAPVTSLLVNP